MTIEEVASDLKTHMSRTEHQYAELKTAIEGNIMSEPVVKNVFEGTNPMASVLPFIGNSGGMGGALGGGLGAGVLGGLLGGVLFNRNGLNGGDGGVTPTQLANSTSSIIDANQNTVLLQAVGDVKAAVPLAEGQVQLALAGAQADLNRSIGASENLLVQGQQGLSREISAAIASSLASQNSINVNVLQSAAATREAVTSFGVANLQATKDSQFATATAISNSTKEIIAALNDQNVANLQRQLTVAESALLENRAESRARGTEVNVTQTVNQNQLQLQAQQQQQQQILLLNNLCNLMGGLQNAVATNSNMIIGNSGPVGTGHQTANPINVRT